MKSFSCTSDEKQINFKSAQESARKDIARTFGVLKRHWQILAALTRSMERKRISNLMYVWIILHNMIIEDEGKTIYHYDENKNLLNVKGVGGRTK